MKTRAFLFVGLALLTACGGGGGNNGSTADVSTGTPPATSGKPPATANSNPFLFVATGDTATAYKIDPQTGVLIASGTPVARRLGPYSIAVDPRGKFAYVDTSLNGVLTFSINATTGDLTVVDGTGVPGGRDGIFMHPSGKFVYVVTGSFNFALGVTGYLVDGESGRLIPMDMPPLSVRPQDPVTSFAIAPDGRFAYMTTHEFKVVTLNIDQATGALSVATGVPVVDSAFPTAITITTDGKFLFFAQRNTPGVVAFSRNAVTGALTQVGEAPLVGDSAPLWMILDSTNKFLYVAASVTGILTYAFDQTSGALTAFGAPIATPDGGAAVRVVRDPSGKFAYVSSYFIDDVNNRSTDTIWTAKIDSDTGAFTFFGQPLASDGFMTTANVSK